MKYNKIGMIVQCLLKGSDAVSRYLTAGVLLILASVVFSGCRRSIPERFGLAPAPTASAITGEDSVSKEDPLLALAETREEAQSIAELYGIELVQWGFGVATYRTEEDPQAVIQRGLENGWPELSLNYIEKAF